MIQRGDEAFDHGDAPALAFTVPTLLKQAGYATGVIGKWHLGLGAQSPTDYNGEIKPGPLDAGFDSAFIIPATGDRTPCVDVQNHRVAGLDPSDLIQLDYSLQRGEPRWLVNVIPRIGADAGSSVQADRQELVYTAITVK